MPATKNHRRHPPRALVIGALQHRIRVEFDGPGASTAAGEFATAWHQLLDDDGDVDRVITVPVAAPGRDALDAAQAWATSLVTLALIELNVSRGLLFHAAAGTDAHGRAFLLVGPSGAGKTTAIAHFARSTSYLTDETAFVDAQADVLPYPKPLSVVREDGGTTQKAPADLGLAVSAHGRFPLRRVLILERYGTGTKREPRTTRLSTAEGIMAVVPELSALSGHPAPLVALARLSRHVGGFERLSYSDVHDIDPNSGPPITPPLEAVDSAFVLPPRRRHVVTGAGLLQAPVDDAIDVSGVILVAQKGEVKALSGIARTIWQETSEPATQDHLLSVLRDAHGRVPDDESHFRRVVEGLVDGGILEWRT